MGERVMYGVVVVTQVYRESDNVVEEMATQDWPTFQDAIKSLRQLGNIEPVSVTIMRDASAHRIAEELGAVAVNPLEETLHD
jgi:predicted nucleic acid-binding protein